MSLHLFFLSRTLKVVRGSASDGVWEGSETRRFHPTHQTLDLNETHPQEGRANDIPGLSDGQADCRKYMHMNLFHGATL
jgi:hypothetical protein